MRTYIVYSKSKLILFSLGPIFVTCVILDCVRKHILPLLELHLTDNPYRRYMSLGCDVMAPPRTRCTHSRAAYATATTPLIIPYSTVVCTCIMIDVCFLSLMPIPYRELSRLHPLCTRRRIRDYCDGAYARKEHSSPPFPAQGCGLSLAQAWSGNTLLCDS